VGLLSLLIAAASSYTAVHSEYCCCTMDTATNHAICVLVTHKASTSMTQTSTVAPYANRPIYTAGNISRGPVSLYSASMITQRTPMPCSVRGACRRSDRRLVGARFGRWREETFGRAKGLRVNPRLTLIHQQVQRCCKRISPTLNLRLPQGEN